jgi:lipid-binding SYLF domain-containing protein
MNGSSASFMARRAILFSALLLFGATIWSSRASAATAQEIASDASHALSQLEQTEPKARDLASKAVAVLVFPSIVKAGLIVGGQTGNGALFEKDKVKAYYNISAVSFGLQAGAQAFGYALFFMNEKALSYLDRSGGWALGAGPSVVVVDKGAAVGFTTTTLTQDVYAIPFGQKGLMAGVGLEGSKITRIHPK